MMIVKYFKPQVYIYKYKNRLSCDGISTNYAQNKELGKDNINFNNKYSIIMLLNVNRMVFINPLNQRNFMQLLFNLYSSYSKKVQGIPHEKR